jgi:nucleotide-binding universal stress UspA family protein
MMGSFAEQLLLVARTPVLVMGAHSDLQASQPQSKILFANDLADPESPILSDVFAFAARLGASVTLLHVVPHPLEPVIQSGVFLLSGGWITADAYREQEHLKQKAVATQVVERARQKYGIECGFKIDESGQSVTESILRYSSDSKSFDFIAMAAESGPVSAALVGSVTRQVVRAAKQPVMVFRRN